MGSIKYDPSWVTRAAGAPRKIWSLGDLAKWANILSLNTAYKWAERQTKSGKLVRLTKGFYALPHRLPASFEMATTLYTPSYVSLASALAFHGILSQAPLAILSVTPKKSRRFRISGMPFEFAHLPPAWFQGFDIHEGAAIATPEKALVDTWYLRCPPDRSDLDTDGLNLRQLAEWVKRLKHPRLDRAWKAWRMSS